MKFLLYIILFLQIISCKIVVLKEMIPQTPGESIMPSDIEKQLVDMEITVDKEFTTIPGFYDENCTEEKLSDNIKDIIFSNSGEKDPNRTPVLKMTREDSTNKRTYIIIPGIFAGAGCLTGLGEGIIRRDNESRVWLWERRANLLEDRRFVKDVFDGKADFSSAGFDEDRDKFYKPSKEEVAFMANWGIDLHLRDLKAVIEEASIDSEEIVLCGFSLGAYYTGMFMAYDFDGVAGYSLVDRAFFLDGPPMTENYIKTEKDYYNGVYTFPLMTKFDGLNSLVNNEVFPVNWDTSQFIEREYISLKARLFPDEISVEEHSSIKGSYKVTNRTHYALSLDDNYQMYKLFTSTFGQANGRHIGSFSPAGTAFLLGPSDGDDYVTWIKPDKPENVDEMEEFIDVDMYLKDFIAYDYNYTEWYQPTRVLLDAGIINNNDSSEGWQSKYFKFIHQAEVDIPVTAVGLTRGLMSNDKLYKKYFDSTSIEKHNIILVDKLRHLDTGMLNDRFSRQYLADIIVKELD